MPPSSHHRSHDMHRCLRILLIPEYAGRVKYCTQKGRHLWRPHHENTSHGVVHLYIKPTRKRFMWPDHNVGPNGPSVFRYESKATIPQKSNTITIMIMNVIKSAFSHAYLSTLRQWRANTGTAIQSKIPKTIYLNANPISNPIVHTESANIALSTSIFVTLPELRFVFKV